MLPLVLFVFFTALVGIVTWSLTRRDDHESSTGYFLAGRTLTGGYIAGSLLLTNLSTEQLVGLNGSAFRDGICVMAWEVIAAASLVVLALAYLPRYLRSGIATVPQFLEERFDVTTRNLATFIFLLAYVVILLPTILYSGATGLAGILNVQELTGISTREGVLWLTVWLIGIVGSIYAIFGGLRTVAVSDTLNGFGLLAGGILISWLGLRAVNADGVFAGLQTLREAHPDKFNSLGGPEQSVPFSTLFTGVLLLNLFYWTTNQQIIQRTFGARNLAEGQKGVLLAGMFKLLAPLILVLPGVIAFHLYSGQDLKADHAYGHLVRNILPQPLVGFFAAVVFGAILSSFNSVLNSSATLFSLGVYQTLLRPNASEAEVIRSGKIFGTLVAIVAMCAAPFLDGQESIFKYLQTMNGIYFIPLFAVMLVGLTTRRVPALAANITLVVGCVAILAGYYFLGHFGRGPQHKITLNEFHFLGLVFAGLVGLMILIGLLRPRSEPWEQRGGHDVDLTGWRWAWPAGLGLIAIVVGVYVSLADTSALTSPSPSLSPQAAVVSPAES